MIRGCRLISFALGVSLCMVLVGCIKKKPQSYWEKNAADFVRQCLNLYAIENPGVAKTNVAQIITNAYHGYPSDLHREFLSYGKHAGFTNSFFEKYVFIPESVTNFIPGVGGKAVLMNSQPFPHDATNINRIVIHENPGDSGMYYSYKTVSEGKVQRLFEEAGVPIPEPPRFPTPPPIPPPPSVPFQKLKRAYFRDLALQLGMSSYHGPVLQNIVEGAGVLSLAVVCFVIFRRIHRRSRKENAKRTP